MNTVPKPDLLVTLSHSGYGNSNAKEALDLALACAAFDQNVALLLRGEAAFLLAKEQDGKHIHSKTLSKTMNALPMYGIECVYVEDVSYANLSDELLSSRSPYETIVLSNELIAELYHSAKTVMQF